MELTPWQQEALDDLDAIEAEYRQHAEQAARDDDAALFDLIRYCARQQQTTLLDLIRYSDGSATSDDLIDRAAEAARATFRRLLGDSPLDAGRLDGVGMLLCDGSGHRTVADYWDPVDCCDGHGDWYVPVWGVCVDCGLYAIADAGIPGWESWLDEQVRLWEPCESPASV